MTELEKAAWAAADVLAEYESMLHAFDVEVNSDASLEAYERVRGVHQRLRAALEAEAGWECCAYVYGTEDSLPILTDGYEYTLMRRPLVDYDNDLDA